MSTTPMVGRNRELATLDAARRRTSVAAQMVMITGEAGVGKTRLVAEFGAALDRGSHMLLGRGSVRGKAVPFSLLVEPIEADLRRLPPERLAALAEGRGRPLAEVVPSLSSTAPGAPVSRLAILDAFAGVLEELAGSRQLIVALDDVHQADPSTREVLEYLARNPPRAPVLLVLAARTEAVKTDPDLATMIDALAKDGLAEELALAPLDRSETESLVGAALGSELIDAGLADRLYERARGNPMLTVAMLEELVDDPEERRMPAGVKERVRRMIGPLPTEDREVLELAAVLGHSFPLETIAALVPTPGGERQLDALVRRGLLAERIDEGAIRYDFVHPLVQEATYDVIGAAARRDMHARVAEASVREPISVRAYHVARGAPAGDAGAVAVLREAARQDERNQSHREALANLQAALRLLDPSDDEQRIEILQEIAWQASVASDHTIGLPALHQLEPLLTEDPAALAGVKRQEASFLATGVGDLEGAARAGDEAVRLIAAGGGEDEFPRVLNELAWIKGEGGDLRAQIEGSGEAVRLADRGGDEITVMHALGARAHALGLVGRIDEAEAASRRALVTAAASGEAEQVGWHVGVLTETLLNGGRLTEATAGIDQLLEEPNPSDVALFARARLDWFLGRWEQGLQDCRTIQSLHPVSPSIHSAWTLSLAAALLAAMGRARAAEPLVRMADRVYRDNEFYVFSAFHRWWSGWVRWLDGDLGGAESLLARAANWLSSMGAFPILTEVLPDLIEVRVAMDALDLAREDVAALVDAAAHTGDPLANAMSAYGRGLFANGSGKTDEAQTMFREARSLADSIGAGLIAARAAEHLGAVLERDERLAMWEEAGRRYAAFPAEALEARLATALRGEGGAGRRAAQGIGTLTVREREIAAMARRGLTVRQMAERLHLSPRTVESHLAHIYRKLGVSGQAELKASGSDVNDV